MNQLFLFAAALAYSGHGLPERIQTVVDIVPALRAGEAIRRAGHGQLDDNTPPCRSAGDAGPPAAQKSYLSRFLAA